MLELFNEHVLKPKDLPSRRQYAATSSNNHIPINRGVPYIIVPNSLTTVISTYNALDFLSQGQWTPTDEKKNSGAKRELEQVTLRPLERAIIIN